MRLALVTHKVDLQDGQGRVNYEIATELLAQGHSVTVIAEACSPEIASHRNGSFVCMREHTLPTQLLRNLYFAFRSGRWVRAHRDEFDLVQANGFVMWEPADVVAVHYVHSAWLKNKFFPFRWGSLSPYAYYQRVLAILNARFEMGAFRQARVLVAVSEETAREVVDLGVDRSRVRVVYNGVDLRQFHPGPEERDSFGLPSGVTLALFAGDIRTPRKNLDTALRALSAVEDLHLVVAGQVDGSPYPALAKLLGVVDRAHFIGLTHRMPALMRSVDFFIMPSRYESFGMVVIEGMATGIPVILSSKVGAVEIAGATSLVLDEPDNVNGLSLALRKMMIGGAGVKSMAKAGRIRALAFDWAQTTSGYLDVYKELLNTSKPVDFDMSAKAQQ